MEERLAALDLGTNTVLLLTARGRAGVPLVEQDELCRVTRLGEGLQHTGRLSASAMARTVAAAAEFAACCSAPGSSGRGIAVATSAVRDAANREEFLECCRASLGARPCVFSGEEEAGTIFAGVTSDQAPASSFLTIDIGGGSTEISAGLPSERVYSASVDVGVVRLGERFGLYEEARAGDVDAARVAVSELMRPVCEHIAELRKSAADAAGVIVSGGTGTTFAAAQLRLREYERSAVHGHIGTDEQVASAFDMLSQLPSAERALLPGISPGRAPVLPSGLLILREFLRLVRVPTFKVSTRGLRYGLLLRMRAGELAPTWTW